MQSWAVVQPRSLGGVGFDRAEELLAEWERCGWVGLVGGEAQLGLELWDELAARLLAASPDSDEAGAVLEESAIACRLAGAAPTHLHVDVVGHLGQRDLRWLVLVDGHQLATSLVSPRVEAPGGDRVLTPLAWRVVRTVELATGGGRLSQHLQVLASLRRWADAVARYDPPGSVTFADHLETFELVDTHKVGVFWTAAGDANRLTMSLQPTLFLSNGERHEVRPDSIDHEPVAKGRDPAKLVASIG